MHADLNDTSQASNPFGFIITFLSFVFLAIAENVSDWHFSEGTMQLFQIFAWGGAGIAGICGGIYYLYMMFTKQNKFHDSN